MIKCVADFETSTDAWLERDNGEARVWAGACVSVSQNPHTLFIVNNIDDFMKGLFDLGKSEVYYHNLRFDGQYIVEWLLKNGYKYNHTGKAMTFESVISASGEWFKIEIVHKKYTKDCIKTTIFDSLKKLPMSVDKIAKAFNLDISKQKIDYDEYRPVGHELTEQEREYILTDCKIVAQALHQQFERGLDRMTIGGDALESYKTMLGRKKFDYLFPQLTDEVDAFIRLAYRGGFVMLNKNYAGKEIAGIGVDVNSLFPAIMRLAPDISKVTGAKMLPYGVPRFFQNKYEPDSEYPLYIQQLACVFDLKKGKLPTIQLKNYAFAKDTEYMTTSRNQAIVLTLTNFDLELFFENYDVVVLDYLGGWKFKGADNLFNDYVDAWYQAKCQATGGGRTIAKLMLNSLYGKTATRPDKTTLKPVSAENGFELKVDRTIKGDTIYTAMATFITSIARCFIIRLAQQLGSHWVYSDTDSMYISGMTLGELSHYINIDAQALGAFKIEHEFDKGKWLRAKTYILHDEQGLHITCAGMPDTIKQSIIDSSNSVDDAFNVFKFGHEFKGKLMPKRVKGGVVLVSQNFTIKP